MQKYFYSEINLCFSIDYYIHTNENNEGKTTLGAPINYQANSIL